MVLGLVSRFRFIAHVLFLPGPVINLLWTSFPHDLENNVVDLDETS